MELKDIKNVGILLRISEEKKDEKNKRISKEETLKNHKETTTEFCKSRGWEFKYYEEVISAGKDLEERTEMQELLNDIPKFDAIVVMELSRLSRQGLVSQQIKKAVIDHRRLIITLNPFTVYDIANKPMDGMIFDMFSGMNEYERRIIGMRIKQNKISMAKQGLNASGSVPLGYRRNPQTKKLEIVEEEAVIVRKAFELCLQGLGNRRIAEELNALGYRSKQGNAFKGTIVKEFFKRETYKGWLVYNDIEKTGKKREIKDSVIIKDAFPAIIPVEIFDQVKKIKFDRAEEYGVFRDKPSKHVHMLKDLVYCKDCKRKTRISFEKARGWLIRRCEDIHNDGTGCKCSGMNSRAAETFVLQDVFAQTELIEQRIKELKSNQFGNMTEELENKKNELEKALAKLKAELRAINKMEMKYEMQLEEDGIRDFEIEEEFEQNKLKNRDARLIIQKQLADVCEKIENRPTPETEIKKLKQKVKLIKQLGKEMPMEEMNVILKQIIKRIWFERILPPEIAAMHQSVPARKNFPATIEIEYF